MPSPPASPTPLSPEEYLTAKLTNARTALLSSDLYLGSASTRDELVWIQDGRAHRLVTKAAAAAAKEAHDSHATNDTDETEDGAGPEPPELATLQTVVLIAEDNCWLTPDGNWKGPGNARNQQAFADIKLTFTGIAPDHAVFADDFKVAVATIEALMSQVKTPGVTNSQGVVVPIDRKTRLRFRHPVFQKNDGEAVTETGDGSLTDEFTIKGWPVYTDAAKDAIKGMQTTHRANYMDAFDMRGDLIAPSSYTKMLRGALVIVRFSLVKYTLGEKADLKNQYVADIASLRVLVPPKPSGPVTPKRKRVYKTDPFTPNIPSPIKKLRTDE